jgi:putative transposase
VALEAVKGQKPSNELAAEFSVHVSQVKLWKKQLLEALPEVFSLRPDRSESEFEAERDLLYRQIGKLQVEVDWLKKRPDISNEYFPEALCHKS